MIADMESYANQNEYRDTMPLGRFLNVRPPLGKPFAILPTWR
jgi:hypothetical protein